MNALDACLFDVSDTSIIFVPDMPEPKMRADVYERIDPYTIHTSSDLVSAISSCPPLVRHFQQLGQQYLNQHAGVDAFMHSLQKPSEQRITRQSLILKLLRRDPEDGWKQWIEYSGDEAIEDFLDIVRDWLAADIDWNESEHFDAIWNGQLAAFRYFDFLPAPFLKALGIEIVYGDCPGSSSSFARMTKTRKEVNKIAELLELDCRFRSEHYKQIMEALHG